MIVLFVLIWGIFIVNACSGNPSPGITPSLEIITPLEKTVYRFGETIDFSTGKLKYISNQNVTQIIPLTDNHVTVAEYDNQKAGDQTITLMYQGLSTSFIVRFIPVAVPSLSLKSSPALTSYYVGEDIVTDGGVITLTDDNGTSEDIAITAEMLTYDNSKKGEAFVNVSYNSMITSFRVVFYPTDSILIKDAEFFENAESMDMTKSYALTCSIDLSKTNFGGFSPSAARAFKGVFDGMGHTVFLGERTAAANQYGGFFGRMENAIVRDIMINAEFTGSSSWIGILAGSASGCLIENVKTYGNIALTGAGAAAGIVEYMINSTMKNCENFASVLINPTTPLNPDTDFMYAAGIACELRGSQLLGCVNNGSISIKNAGCPAYAGGIISYTRYDSSFLPLIVKDCVNHADILLHNFIYAELGGISGLIYSTGTEKHGMQLLSGCKNNGDITLVNDGQAYHEAYAGGITGAAYVFYFSEENFGKGTINNCVNTGKIISDILQENEFCNCNTDDICAWSYDDSCLIIN